MVKRCSPEPSGTTALCVPTRHPSQAARKRSAQGQTTHNGSHHGMPWQAGPYRKFQNVGENHHFLADPATNRTLRSVIMAEFHFLFPSSVAVLGRAASLRGTGLRTRCRKLKAPPCLSRIPESSCPDPLNHAWPSAAKNDSTDPQTALASVTQQAALA